jgi:hypothetical protein
VVDKLVDYANARNTIGNWRNEVFFIADDGDGNLHQRDADKLATMVDSSFTQFNTNKIYVDSYEQVETSIGESAPGVNEAIDQNIHKGGLIFNFTGHGSPTRWTSETILNISSITEFENGDRLPLFVTATCEFGRHDNPKAISGAEYLLLNPKGGAIGLVTTSRPVFSSTNFILNKAFYDNIFKKEEGKFQSLGEVFRKTKNQSLNGSINRNFSLLGDPSMTLAYAKNDIRIVADENAYQPGDTLKALGKVKLSGEVITANDQIDTDFNGKLVMTVFDRANEVETLGHEGATMRYLVRDNIIFRGEARVTNGAFEIEFIVPNNIDYQFDQGKISMYAYDTSTYRDAAGADIDFVVGGKSDDVINDNTPPVITIFINDTTFINGGITGPDVSLVALLEDESGINTTNSATGEEMTIILDDSLTYRANHYYVAAPDNYQKGWVTYPFKDLSMGTHKMQLLVWDVHQNFSQAEITFRVTEENEIRIEHLRNYPNPFQDRTEFVFEHNRAGEDLEINIELFTSTGMLVKQMNYVIENSPSRISDIFWDTRQQNGSNLLGGLFIMRIGVRSLADGSKNYANHKFVKFN